MTLARLRATRTAHQIAREIQAREAFSPDMVNCRRCGQSFLSDTPRRACQGCIAAARKCLEWARLSRKRGTFSTARTEFDPAAEDRAFAEVIDDLKFLPGARSE